MKRNYSFPPIIYEIGFNNTCIVLAAEPSDDQKCSAWLYWFTSIQIFSVNKPEMAQISITL